MVIGGQESDAGTKTSKGKKQRNPFRKMFKDKAGSMKS